MNRTLCVFLLMVTIARNVKTEQLHDITIAYPNGGLNWPIFIATDGGYYRRHGLKVTLSFAPHPSGVAMLVSGQAQVLHYSLGQMMQAAMSDNSLTMISSMINRGVFALLARSEIATISNLKGKRIGVGQIGDANYSYTTAILENAGLSARDVEWVPLGPSVDARAAALLSHRVDAAILTAPTYFKVIGPTVKELTTFSGRTDIFASAVIVMTRRTIAEHPEMPRQLIEAHAEAIKRFYDDKEFAVQTFLRYDRSAKSSDVEQLYALYERPRAFERVPYVLAEAVRATIRQESDPQTLMRLKTFDFRKVIDNDAVDTLVHEGVLDRLFGSSLRAEEVHKMQAAFGR
jgi:ABC-type nitrate/sulfonate/bicarbonate transport system substrate-binding protein